MAIPTLAMISDAGRGNPEIVAPQKMLSGIFNDALKKNNQSQRGNTTNDTIHNYNIDVQMTGNMSNKKEMEKVVEDEFGKNFQGVKNRGGISYR